MLTIACDKADTHDTHDNRDTHDSIPVRAQRLVNGVGHWIGFQRLAIVPTPGGKA
jgi:hypothetical protein